MLLKKKNLSESEIEEIRKTFNELEKSLRFKKFHGNIDSVDYEDLDNYDYNYEFAAADDDDDDNDDDNDELFLWYG